MNFHSWMVGCCIDVEADQKTLARSAIRWCFERGDPKTPADRWTLNRVAELPFPTPKGMRLSYKFGAP